MKQQKYISIVIYDFRNRKFIIYRNALAMIEVEILFFFSLKKKRLLHYTFIFHLSSVNFICNGQRETAPEKIISFLNWVKRRRQFLSTVNKHINNTRKLCWYDRLNSPIKRSLSRPFQRHIHRKVRKPFRVFWAVILVRIPRQPGKLMTLWSL